MTHKRTTTDVVLRTYPMRFGYAPARALVDFSTGPKQWHITGHWTFQERLSRRRMWTVRREFLANNPGTCDDWSATLSNRYPGMLQNSQQSGASAIGAVLIRTGGSEAVLVTIEEHPRAGDTLTSVQCDKEIDDVIPGKRYVSGRHRCQNRTTDPSGRCHLHRQSRTRIR